MMKTKNTVILFIGIAFTCIIASWLYICSDEEIQHLYASYPEVKEECPEIKEYLTGESVTVFKCLSGGLIVAPNTVDN